MLQLKRCATTTWHINKRDLVKNTKTHAITRLLRFVLFCFLLLLLSWSSSGGGGRTTCWSRLTSPYFAEEVFNVDFGQGFCQQARPESFNVDTSCFNEGTGSMRWGMPARTSPRCEEVDMSARTSPRCEEMEACLLEHPRGVR